MHGAPMAVTSDGTVLVNLTHVLDGEDALTLVDALPKNATVFVGIAVPDRSRQKVMHTIDNATAELVAIIGGKRALGIASASGPSSEEQASTRRGRREDRAPRRRDRRPSP